ncbi:MAG: HEPN domain-containing protein [Melioribacteraceae bacterium]|nr:HEPN domain-containing protein [Melioribacteraceae bacterium]MCF8264002.1 HEPN domain-containing protein [Melioribacteraceae bacterium]MCF8412576.1 HEPN domain-containing protein [Melioribacteraceae bacterium]MCF8431043.1 HEPN domain-containing protein [Melioribacteraceae bacterium]
MSEKSFDANKLVEFWVESSDEDYEAMLVLNESHKFGWTLFIGHLTIEKLLKAYFVWSKKNYPPLTHNLLRLAESSDLQLDFDKKESLATITTFNINTRYDDYKMSFKQKADKEFTEKWVDEIKKIRSWIKEQLK